MPIMWESDRTRKRELINCSAHKGNVDEARCRHTGASGLTQILLVPAARVRISRLHVWQRAVVIFSLLSVATWKPWKCRECWDFQTLKSWKLETLYCYITFVLGTSLQCSRFQGFKDFIGFNASRIASRYLSSSNSIGWKTLKPWHLDCFMESYKPRNHETLQLLWNLATS